MPITAAEVESNGWVLRLVVSGSLTVPDTDFGAYALDPDGAPRVTMATSHAGFVKSGGIAVPGALARTLVATRPLRKPVNPASPAVRIIDETDLGGGSIRVRLALSDHVYASDTGLTLAVLPGWRAGEGAVSGLAVSNGSTRAAPLPVMRWVLAPYEVTAGAFRVSLFVAAHHPQGFEPVAGVKFTASDGTTVKTVWTTALDTDNSYGDALRCYTAIIDPAAATALNAGLLRIDAEVYPWLGAMRTTDPAGTRLMTALRTAGFSAAPESPWVIGYDPAGTRYGQQFVFVDPVNGTGTASAAMVAASLAGAKAVAPASRARDINTACQAGYLANRTLAAANGQAAQTRSIDGMTIVLAAGLHPGLGTTAVTTGLATAEIPVRVMGDPDDASPRDNCILRTGTNPTSRATRFRWQTLTVEQGTNQLSSAVFQFIDDAIFRGKPGLESNSAAPFTGAPAAGNWGICATRSRFWRYGGSLGAGNMRVGLYRANETSRNINSYTAALKNRLIPPAEDGFVGTGALTSFFGNIAAPTIAGQVEDLVVAYNDLRYMRGRIMGFGTWPAGSAGTPSASIRRVVIMNNLCEHIGALSNPFYAIGEDVNCTMTYNIIEGNTFAGDRCNTLYSDPLPTTLAECDTLLNHAWGNRVANNVFDWWPCKHDDVNDNASQTLRGTNGYRPQMVEAWSSLFGVGYEGNYDTARTTGSNFEHQWPGLRSVQNLFGESVSPLYADDQSFAAGGAAAPGGGNYMPLAGSPLLGRVLRGNSDRDFAGNPRAAGGAAGALQPLSGPEPDLVLAPDVAVSAQRASVPGIAILLGLVPGSARHLGFADAAMLGWSVGLVPAAIVQPSRASASGLSTAEEGTLLIPADARHQLPSGSVVILPDSGGNGVATLSIAVDLRTLAIR